MLPILRNIRLLRNMPVCLRKRCKDSRNVTFGHTTDGNLPTDTMVKMKNCAVIILNWNGKRFLERFLDGVVKMSSECDVVVADNGSEDGSQQYVRDNFTNVKLLEFDKNYGFAGGYNRAVAAVENEYVCLLNSDVEVTDGWYKAPLEHLRSNPDCAACQPKILSLSNKDSFEFAGASGGYIDFLGYPFCRGRVVGSIEKDCGQYDTSEKVFWATGACFFVRRTDFLSFGGLDENFIAHQEEIDLCWRFNARGKYVAVIPQASVFHLGGGTLNASNPYKTYLNFRNNQLMLYKNMGGWRYVYVFFVRILLDYLSAILFLLQGKSKDAAAVFKARRDFHKMRSLLKDVREENIERTVVQKIPTIYGGSMLFAYYVSGKKTFQALMPNKS